MRNFSAWLEYDGSDFCGWEKQPEKRSVRGELEKAVSRIAAKKTRVIGSSRTDAGVHALKHRINFLLARDISPKKLAFAMNSLLPDDIRILDIREMKKDFHARFDAKAKTYEYYVYCGHRLPVQLRRQVLLVRDKLDLFAMQRAARDLLGKHDFSAFCTVKDPKDDHVRELKKISVWKEKVRFFPDRKPIELLAFSFTGNGFLYKMVRTLVGTLLDVGRGRIAVREVRDILGSKDRRRAGKTVPGRGLCLMRVRY